MARSSTFRNVALIWLAATVAVLVMGFRQAIFASPPEATMGDLYRIFYYHFAHAILGLVFPYLNLIASVAFLYYKRRDPLKALAADAFAVASAEITVLYVGITLATGMLWGKPAWGIWWTWDSRLTSELILWLLFISYMLLRRLSPSGQTSTFAAVLSVFAAIDVPIVFMSIEWWRTQHPQPVFGPNGGGIAPQFVPAVLWNLAGWTMWGIFLIGLRFAVERRRQIADQEAALQALEASLETPQ